MPPETEKANIFPSYAFIDKNYQESRWDTIMDPADKYIKVENIYDYIHYFLIKYASDLGIDLNSEDALFDVSMNFLKLKLYIFQKCCNDFTSKYCNDFEGETNIYNDSNVSLYTLNQKTILPTIDNNDSYNEMIDPLKWKNPFFTDEDTQKMKTLIGTILNMSSYGYTSTDLKDSSRDQCYNNSLYYFSFNMPLMYQPLLSTFTIKSDTNFSTIPLV
ncbi:hypothetical protein FACS189459_0610 [Bacilli bacterium]|nr:hypothetical protein FACS189459_0610 [Bacilli bacterium]